MSQTLKLHTQIGAADFHDNTNVVEAPNGFTANVMILPDDAHSTVADLYQVGTFTAPYNSKSQVVTLPDVDVPEGSQPVKLSIRPVASYLMRSEGNGTTDSNGVADNLTRVDDTIDTDRDRIVLSNMTVGDKDLELIGTLVLGKSGAKVVTYSGTGNAPSGTFDIPTLGTNSTVSALNLDNIISYPVATVKTTIQAGVPFTKFIIKKGYPLPSDTSAVDSTGSLIEFSKMQGLVDGSGNLLDEYEVDGSVVNFVAPFQSAGIVFPAHTQVPEGTLVELVITTNGVPGYTAGGNASTSGTNGKKLILYPYGGMPQFTIDLSSGTKVDALVPLYDGSSVPPGYRFKAGTSFSDANSAGVNYQVHFRNVVGAAGFQLAPTTTLQYVVPTASPAKIRSGMTTSSAISLPAGSSTTEPLDVENGLSFPSGVSLVSVLTIKEQLDIDSSVVAAKDSVLGVGTKIASGSASLEGSIITTPITLDSNSTVSDEYDVTSPFTVTANATLNVGAEIRDATLPSGTEITPNNILPALLKITTSMGVSLLAAAELIVGTVMGSGYQLKGNLGFSPKGVIPAFSSITGIFDLPARTHLKAGALFTTTDVPVPDGTTLRKDSVMPKGFIFGEGSHLPEFDLSTQLPAIADATAASNPLVLDSNDTGANGDDFIRLGAGIVLVSGFLLQKGSVFSAKTAGGTTGYTQAIKTNGDGYDSTSSHAALTLNAAEYSLDAGLSAAAEDLTLYSGDVVPMDIYLTTDVHTDRELFLKYDGSSNALKKVQLTSNFSLANDLVLDADYKVSGSNTTFWPRNHPLPFDFTLTASAVFGASGVATMLNRDIQLNVPTTQDYVYGILPSASILKFPAQAYTLTSNIKLASDIGSTVGTTATSGYYASKAPIDLPKGAKLATSAAVKLITPMQFNGTFAIATDITTHPKFVANGGIKLLGGHVFPGSVTIPAGSPLPKNITLSTDVTLAAAYVVTLTSFTLSSGSSLGAESVLAAGSSFPTGLDIYAKVQLAPIVSLDSANIFGLFDDETINADIKFPQIWNSTANAVAVPNFNASGLIKRILDLVNQVASLEQQIQHQ
jgi:hypothetical protein